MKLVSNTIGNIENPSENDIIRAFRDDWGDVPGNIYSLKLDNGNEIHSISGAFFKEFSLSISHEAGVYLTCKSFFTADQVIEYFIKFYHGDKDFIKNLEWAEYKRISLSKTLISFIRNKLKFPAPR